MGSPDNEAVCNTLERLRRISKQSDDKRLEMVSLGVLGQLKRLVSERGNDVKVKERVVVLLVYLAKTESNRDALRDEGCLDLLAAELSSPVPVVLHNTMAALVNATINNADNQNALREDGSLATVVELMTSPASKTRHNACWLLKKMATNNAKNRDAMREHGAIRNIVPLLSRQEPPEVREHAVALLAVLLDKHARNRMTFKELQGAPAALQGLHDSEQGTGSKTEEYARHAMESLGIKRRDGNSGSMTSSNSLSVPSRRDPGSKSPRDVSASPREGGSHKGSKSPRDGKNGGASPRREEKTSPRPLGKTPDPIPGKPEKEKKGFALFGRSKKEAKEAKDESAALMVSSGRRSRGEEEIDKWE